MPYSTIAIAVSGHGREREHLRQGIALAQHCQATLRFIHVDSTLIVPIGYPTGEVIETLAEPDNPCRSEAGFKNYLHENAAGDTANLTVSYEILSGDAISELVTISKEVDLLVLGHHLNGILEWFLHSSDERILEKSACPVLIVPEDEE